MMLIDTHAHLYAKEFDEDREAVLQEAINVGVKKILLPNIDESSIEGMHALCEQFPDVCFPMMGLHPCSVKANYEEQLATIKAAFQVNKHIAIGEIGIDLYWDKSLVREQMLAFEAQIKWAKEVGLPIVIHARDSFDEIFEVVDGLNDERLTGIFHCFTGTEEQAHKILNYGGFKLGIGGVVTFKNSGLSEVLKNVPLTALVLETDAPYLAPVPKRGKRNESAYVSYIATHLTEVYNCSLATIAEQTTSNALSVFNLTTE